MKVYLILFIALVIHSCTKKISVERTTNFPKQAVRMSSEEIRKNVWVFILAGQSNMAGRGFVEPKDTLTNKRILTINKEGQVILAKEPLHFYEPERTGLDCGLSFAQSLLKKIPDSISLLIIPTAIGGSSISQWLGDSVHHNVKLFSNFKAKVELAQQFGTIKGILWHQGESDANEKDIPKYEERLAELLTNFRKVTGNANLPVLIGELGSYSANKNNWVMINRAIQNYSLRDKNSAVISTNDLKDKGDSIHFNARGQRTMGKRFAKAYFDKFLK